MTILEVYESRTGFQELLRAPRQQFCRGTFRKEKQRSKPLLRFFARASRPGTAKTRGARLDKSFVGGPKGELVLFAEHESERQRTCTACCAKGYRRQLGKPTRFRSSAALSEMQRRPTLDASTGPCKPLPWQAAVLHRWEASMGRVPAAMT